MFMKKYSCEEEELTGGRFKFNANCFGFQIDDVTQIAKSSRVCIICN